MKMKRLSVLLVFALGCSSLVNSALEDNDGDAGADATTPDAETPDAETPDAETPDAETPDAGTLFDCRRMPDGTECGDSQICINNLCESSRCGDGIVAGDEECDELDDVSGDGCEPGSCVFSCTTAEDCNDANDCTVNTCADHICESNDAANGADCEPPTGDSGMCNDGLCLGAGCGNGVREGTEECDDASPGCVACQFVCKSNEECADEFFCNGEETCNTADHVCVDAAPLACDDDDECTLDSCSESSQMCINTLIDEDGDGYAADTLTCADPEQGGDCDPTEGSINPGAAEFCDGVDNNCDGSIDETDEVLCFPDQDEDGFGGGSGVTRNCECLPGEIGRGGDCNDRNRSVRPTQTSYFPEPHCVGREEECFDYNCQRGAEPQAVAIGRCTSLGRFCSLSQGWVAREAPPCGVAERWMTGCISDGAIGCVSTNEVRVQQCR